MALMNDTCIADNRTGSYETLPLSREASLLLTIGQICTRTLPLDNEITPHDTPSPARSDAVPGSYNGASRPGIDDYTLCHICDAPILRGDDMQVHVNSPECRKRQARREAKCRSVHYPENLQRGRAQSQVATAFSDGSYTVTFSHVPALFARVLDRSASVTPAVHKGDKIETQRLLPGPDVWGPASVSNSVSQSGPTLPPTAVAPRPLSWGIVNQAPASKNVSRARRPASAPKKASHARRIPLPPAAKPRVLTLPDVSRQPGGSASSNASPAAPIPPPRVRRAPRLPSDRPISRETMLKHLSADYPVVPPPGYEYRCPVKTCPDICTSKFTLLRHIRAHGPPEFDCKWCELAYARRDSLASHQKKYCKKRPEGFRGPWPQILGE